MMTTRRTTMTMMTTMKKTMMTKKMTTMMKRTMTMMTMMTNHRLIRKKAPKAVRMMLPLRSPLMPRNLILNLKRM